MRFTLTFEGDLPPSGSVGQKHEIRRQFHPQLKELWNTEPLSAMKNAAELGGICYAEVDGRPFSSVVHRSLRLRAELRIALLRPEAPGGILRNADIDNRLKTLFDALRSPTQKQEIPSTWIPDENESPLHCLLEDDCLITGVEVTTDRWLGAPSPTCVRLFIGVKVWTLTPTWGSVMLGG